MLSDKVVLPSTTEALTVLGNSIRVGRKQRRWMVNELAERLGVSEPTVRKIERGSPTVAIGTVFEAAGLVGVTLFDPEPRRRESFANTKRLELALLPASIRGRIEIDDAF